MTAQRPSLQVGAAIARGGDVNACRPEGDMPLHVACRAGNLEVVKLLVAKASEGGTGGRGISPGIKSERPARNRRCVQGADVNAEDRTAVCRTPLHYAADAYAGDTEGDPRFEEVLQVLVDAGAVSLADKKGNLPSVGDEADFVVQKLMERAEKGGEAARKAQKERRMQAARDIMNAKQVGRDDD